MVMPIDAGSLTRRDLLRYCAGAYTAVWPLAVFSSGSPQLPGNMSAYRRPGTSQNISFEAVAVQLPFGERIRERFIVDGSLILSDTGVIGSVTVTFADRTTAQIRCFGREFVITYRGVIVRHSMEGDKVEVNGAIGNVRPVVEKLIAENEFLGIGSLSDQSRAVIALNALANTDAFLNAMSATGSSEGRRMIEALCRLSPAPSAGYWNRQERKAV